MSTAPVSGMVRNGLLALLVNDSQATQTQLNKLTQQSASGKVADTYGGLGTGASVSIDLRPQMAQVSAWQQNISTANGSLSTTQSVLGQLTSIANTFSSAALGAGMTDSTGIAAVAVQAKAALQQVVALLNTQTSGQYVFAGTNSTTAPVSTSLPSWVISASGAGTVVAGLASGTDPATVVQNLVTTASGWNLAAPGSAQPTGAAAAALQTQTGDGQTATMAFVAGQNSFAPKSASATGSYVGDLVAGLAGLAALGSSTASESTMVSYGAAISQLLQGAGTAMTTEEAGFGQVQATLTTQTTTLSDTLTSLKTQVSSVENVDMAATATALAQVQTQLQASFQLIAGLKQLSLTAYL
jgi:flagellar hook-associated protein 3 FlgL